MRVQDEDEDGDDQCGTKNRMVPEGREEVDTKSNQSMLGAER